MKHGLASALCLLSLALLMSACGKSQDTLNVDGENFELGSILGGDGELQGFKFADRIREFRFPEDHGPHPRYRNEWWYLIGNLETSDGQGFGYQFTIFRNALAPEPTESSSQWRTNQAYMAHFAISDFDNRIHLAAERFGRGAAGIAGAENPPLRVWLDDWRLEASDPSGFPLRLTARTADMSLDLTLTPAKPLVLNGDRGLDHKGGGPGNASYYYSHTRLQTQGEIRIENDRLTVAGTSWLDREWSTSALAEDQSGWDWFALQFEDGTDLMVYRMRRKDGTTDPASGGTFVDVQGNARRLVSEELEFQVVDTWTSPKTGVVYPLEWRLTLPTLGLELNVEPVFQEQEMDLSVRYWEGAIRVSGMKGESALAGRGYLELAGY